MNLLESIQTLGELERSALSSIRIERDSSGYRARFDFALKLPRPEALELPAGVELQGFARWPEQELLLDWRTPALDQIKALDQSGLCGRLDWFEPRPDAWTVKTHAGSDQERRAWLFGLQS
jgi:hypothetical protein